MKKILVLAFISFFTISFAQDLLDIQWNVIEQPHEVGGEEFVQVEELLPGEEFLPGEEGDITEEFTGEAEFSEEAIFTL